MGGAQVNVATCAPLILGNMVPVSEAPILPFSNVKFNICASATNMDMCFYLASLAKTLSLSSQIYIQHSGN